MQYDPVKKTVGRIFSGPVVMRKVFYLSLDLLLLRAWHVRRALRALAREYPGEARILDAGSGFGQYSWRMSRMNRNWKIKAVDIDPEHIESTREFFRMTGLSERVVCEKLDLTELMEEETFSFILSVDVMEHIENAGIHSGDSACVLPPATIGGNLIRQIKEATCRIEKELKVIGLMNIQFAIKVRTLYVLEVNPRASRTVPFVSKATGNPFAKIVRTSPSVLIARSSIW